MIFSKNILNKITLIITFFLSMPFACSYFEDEQSSQNNFNATSNNTNNVNNIQPTQFRIKGRVWSPGADDETIIPSNKFPIQGALVAAYPYEPDPPPGRYYCNECVKINKDVIYTMSGDDGSFELNLNPDTDYYLLVQKGMFRRVTLYHTGKAGDLRIFNSKDEWEAKETRFTLPNTHDPEEGKWIPRILIIKGRGEPYMNIPFQAMGFEYNIDFEQINDTEAEYVVGNIEELKKYSIILVTCGDEATFLTKSKVKESLREYIKGGGKLFIDDFAYDWAEQPFPEFMSFVVDYPIDYEKGVCALENSPPDIIGKCVNYSCYNPMGTVKDEALTAWLKHIHPYSDLSMEYGCNIMHELRPSLQGECDNPEDEECIDGKKYAKPKVWITGSWLEYTEKPLILSWDYYCGKVLYTVLHIHAHGNSLGGYELKTQEKIMIYLLLEIQTCKEPEIIE